LEDPQKRGNCPFMGVSTLEYYKKKGGKIKNTLSGRRKNLTGRITQGGKKTKTVQ